MLSDHNLLAATRNELCDALKILLQAGRMGATDFEGARRHAQEALAGLERLIAASPE